MVCHRIILVEDVLRGIVKAMLMIRDLVVRLSISMWSSIGVRFIPKSFDPYHNMSEPIILYDIPSKNPKHTAWSPNTWKTR